MSNKCEIHLQGSLFNLEESRAMIEKRLSEMSPDELTGTKNLQYRDIQLMVEDEITRKVQNVSDMLKIEVEKRNALVDLKTGKPITKLGDALTAWNNRLSGRNSIDTKRRTLKSHLVTKLDEIESIFKTKENPRFKSLRDIAPDSKEEMELFIKVRNYTEEIDPSKLTPESVAKMLKDSDELDRLAYSIVAHNAYTRKTLAQAGVATKFNKFFVMKRRYDWAKIEAMGEDGFINFMKTHLDLEKTFGKRLEDAELTKRLKDIHREFELSASSRTSVLDVGDAGGSSRANSLSRKLVYQDDGGMSEYAVFKELSVGGMRDQFEKNATNSAETAIKVSELGYNSDIVFDSVVKHIEETLGTKRSALDSFKEARIKAAYLELSGQQNLVQTGLTTFSNTVRTGLSVAYLGNALTSALLDPLDNLRQGFYVNGDLFGGLGDHISSMKKVIETRFKGKEELNEIASELGVIYSYISNGEGMRLASGDMATTGGKISDLVAKHGGTAMNIATLLPMQTGLSKVASGMSAARQFSKLLDSPNLNKFQLDTLKEYKFSDAEINVMRTMVERTNTWTDNVITPANIRNSLLNKNPEEIAQALGVSAMDAGKAALDLSMKYETFINDWVVRGTPAPELATKTLLLKTDENEMRRVIRNLGTQFLDTPVAQLQNFSELIDKVIRVNTQNGNFNRTGFSADMMQHLGAYLMMGVPMFLAADAAMSIATQRESVFDKFRNADDKGQMAIMAQVIGRTSAVPFVVEVLENQFLSEYNKTAADTFSGSPALSYLNDSLKLAQALPTGDSEKIWKRTKRLLPSNALPVRAITNWSAQAGINPFHDGENLRGSGGNYGF